MLTEVVVSYLSLETFVPKDIVRGRAGRSLVQVRKAMPCGCNSFLLAIEKNRGKDGLTVDFSEGYTSSILNGWFMNPGVGEMLEGKH